MLLVEKFEIAQDKILEGIDTYNISLILEGSDAFDKAVKDFLDIVEQMGLIYAGDVGLGKAMGEILEDLSDKAKKAQQANDDEDEDIDFGANWKNLLKAKSPWSGGESHMTTLNAHAAKLDILTIGMKEIIIKIAQMCEKYPEIFAINDEGIAIKDKTVNKELTLAAIAGKKGEELINAFKIGEPPEDGDEPGNEEQSETNDSETQLSHYSRDGAVITELFGFGGGGGKSDLELVYKNFKPLLDQIPGDKRQQAKKLYAYFQELADASKDLKKVFTNILTQQEPSSKFQDVVKNTRGKWMRKIFSDQGTDYKLTKEEVEKMVNAVFETPFSKLGTVVKNLIKVEKGEKLEAVVEDTAGATDEQEQTTNNQLEENPDAQQKIEKAGEIAERINKKLDGVEVTTEEVIQMLAKFDADKNADVKEVIKEVLGIKVPYFEGEEKEQFFIAIGQEFNLPGTPREDSETPTPAGEDNIPQGTIDTIVDDSLEQTGGPDDAIDAAIEGWRNSISKSAARAASKPKVQKLSSSLQQIVPGADELKLHNTADTWQDDVNLANNKNYSKPAHESLKDVLSVFEEKEETVDDSSDNKQPEDKPYAAKKVSKSGKEYVNSLNAWTKGKGGDVIRDVLADMELIKYEDMKRMTKQEFKKKMLQSIKNVKNKTPTNQNKKRQTLNALEYIVTGKGKKSHKESAKISFDDMIEWIGNNLKYELLSESQTYQRWAVLAGILND